jgi:drug/metabolite transporter (DMT)-like permease
MLSSGWIEAIVYVWVIAALNITYAVGIALGVHPAAFLLEGFFAAAVCLLVIAGPGKYPHRIIAVPQTWAYGLCTIGCEIFYYLMMDYVPPADASIFVRINVPISIAIGWFFFRRRVSGARLWGCLAILLAIAVTGWWFPATHVAGFAGAALATAIAMASRNFFAEFHPWNRAARTVIEKMRVVGLVVLVTSLCGLAVTFFLSLLVAHSIMPSTPALPTIAQMLHGPTILLALVLGCAIITAMQYLMFSAVVKITSENFFAMMVLTPFATLVLQEIMGRLGLPGVTAGGWYILPFLCVLMIGNVLVIWPPLASGSTRKP